MRLAAIVLVFAAACAHGPAPAPGDIVWSGEVRVEGTVEVPAGRTLFVRPGTLVRFAYRDDDGDGRGDAALIVKGRILAEGRAAAPIAFESEGRGGGIGWGEIRIEKGVEALFRSCRFSGAQWAVHSHLTPLVVEACAFEGNEGGVKFRGGPVVISDSRFVANGTAVRYWESAPLVRGNRFERNDTAVFCREGSRGSVLRGNNFVASADYHVKLGEAQADDVDARRNWWGTGEPAEIERLFFDRVDSEYLGRVDFLPIEPKPLRLSGPAGKGGA